MSLTSNDPDGEMELHKKDFHHPYTPYPIQETFMQTVYDVLEQGKIGILESPTGTGKSLSLICGSLTWLRDFKRRGFEGLLNDGVGDSEEPEWVVEMAKERRRREMMRKREEMEERLKRVRERERKERDRMGGKGSMRDSKRRKVGGDGGGDMVGEKGGEDEFLLEDWDSDAEVSGGGKGKTGDEAIFSRETLELMESVGMRSKKLEDEEEEQDDEMKIFYCSRTHSQLAQFINELRRVEFPSSMPPEDSASKSKEKEKDTDTFHEKLKHLTLGSRKNLCINPKVNKLTSSTAINERCAELQQASTPKEQKCPHIPNKENRLLVNNFRDHTLANLRDIEDMGALGKEISICPYYASRSVIKPAEIVTLPYPLLLQRSARESLGISLKGHVVIIDEAHNLMDAIAGIYGTEMSLKELKLGREMLVNYMKRFANKLKGKNRMYLAQVVRVMNSLVGYLEKKLEGKEIDGVVDGKELLAGKTVDQINLFKLIRYLQESKLARKVESYTIHSLATTTTSQPNPSSYKGKVPPKPPTTPILHTLTSLLLALTHPTSEGQLFFNKQSVDIITLKFQLLDPASHFEPIVTEARAVILAGGTMSPFSDYTSLLFPTIPTGRITTLSCGHVVPKTSLFASTVAKGPTGVDFRWTYDNRRNTDMIDELGRALVNICTVVPDGIVVFFPSYDFLATILARFRVVPPDTRLSTLSKLESKKGIFVESKMESVEDILGRYAKSIDEGKGGLLFSVVGGKLSEGINFSDGLGRCVVIVGLPFPNANTAEWKRKLEFIQESAVARLSAPFTSGGIIGGGGGGGGGGGEAMVKGAGMTREEIAKVAKEEAMEFYQNVCMRAVNQSVGRAIRHRGDWAGILMVDERYRRDSIRGKLAGWIRGEVREENGFGRLIGGLGAFCKGKKV
ncbi:hypothetical protein DSL72_003087 [Monilinia vaccinii-corymbosi]|uniref:ATP-dependent DNA helicase CHL1 n=1 Tax=Monilinia vaccinii-corymbosi TaxID=61207 RepID=A0A8A3P583_9HELO|nr:hypothetical protein DSL72_003087 [Monilinia vaccinii-corymbosi]